MIHRKSYSYRDSRLIEEIAPGNANILVFSDGGFREQDGIGSAGWIAYVLGVLGGTKEVTFT